MTGRAAVYVSGAVVFTVPVRANKKTSVEVRAAGLGGRIGRGGV